MEPAGECGHGRGLPVRRPRSAAGARRTWEAGAGFPFAGWHSAKELAIWAGSILPAFSTHIEVSHERIAVLSEMSFRVHL